MDLQASRVAKGKTRADFAERLGVSHQTITNWENGEQGIKDEMVPAVAKLYGVSVMKLARYLSERDRRRRSERRQEMASSK